MDII
jgi:hypothetical protein